VVFRRQFKKEKKKKTGRTPVVGGAPIRSPAPLNAGAGEGGEGETQQPRTGLPLPTPYQKRKGKKKKGGEGTGDPLFGPLEAVCAETGLALAKNPRLMNARPRRGPGASPLKHCPSL